MVWDVLTRTLHPHLFLGGGEASLGAALSPIAATGTDRASPGCRSCTIPIY